MQKERATPVSQSGLLNKWCTKPTHHWASLLHLMGSQASCNLFYTFELLRLYCCRLRTMCCVGFSQYSAYVRLCIICIFGCSARHLEYLQLVGVCAFSVHLQACLGCPGKYLVNPIPMYDKYTATGPRVGPKLGLGPSSEPSFPTEAFQWG